MLMAGAPSKGPTDVVFTPALQRVFVSFLMAGALERKVPVS
jgi:hypothetical protein